MVNSNTDVVGMNAGRIVNPLPNWIDSINACRTWAGAQRVAAWLTNAAQARRDTVTDGDYWYTQSKALAPHLYAAAAANASMGDVVRWFDLENDTEVRHILAAAEAEDPEAAHAAAQSLWAKAPRLRSSVYATLENVVAGYADPGVADLEATAGIDLDTWLRERGTLYVVAASHD